MKKNDYKSSVRVWPCAMCDDGENLWIAHGLLNALFRYNVTSDCAEVACVYDKDICGTESLMCAVLKHENRIISIPFLGRNIYIYDCVAKSKRVIEMNNKIRVGRNRAFCDAFLYNFRIYCVPATSSHLLVVNPENGEVEQSFNLEMELRNCGVPSLDINSAVLTNGGVVWAVLTGSNRLLSIDLNRMKIGIHEVGNEKEKMSSLALLDDDLIAIVYKGEGCCRKIINVDNDKVLLEPESAAIIRSCNGGILVDSLDSDWIKKIDGDGCVIWTEIEKIDDACEIAYSYNHGVLESCKNKEYYFSRREYKLKCIKGDLMEVGGRQIVCEVDLSSFWNRKQMLSENKLMDLQWLMNDLRDE